VTAPEPPTLRVVRGTPTPEELAVVAAVVAAASGAAADEPAPEPRRGRWNDPAARHRRDWLPGPGAWRASAR
jgi:acyl-CoA carboxylase epsilon subunit